MRLYANQTGPVFLYIEPSQRVRFPELDIKVEKINSFDIKLSQQIIELDRRDLYFLCLSSFYEGLHSRRFRQVSWVLDNVEVRFLIRSIGYKEGKKTGVRTEIKIALLEFTIGINRDTVPAEIFFQIIGVAFILIVIGSDIQEKTIPAVAEKVPDDNFFVTL